MFYENSFVVAADTCELPCDLALHLTLLLKWHSKQQDTVIFLNIVAMVTKYIEVKYTVFLYIYS